MEAANGRAPGFDKTGPDRGLQLFAKDRGLHVALRFREEQEASWLQRPRQFGEEAVRIRDLVHDGESQHKINVCEVGDAQRLRGGEARLDTVKESGFPGATLEPLDHARLEVYGDDVSLWPNLARQLEG